MMDVAPHPNYAQNGWVYIGYVHALGDPTTRETPAMTRIIRGRVEGHRWVEQETVFAVPDDLHFARGTRWGCRFFFDKDGYLYFSIGDIGRNDEVQQPSKPGGKVYRIMPDGSIPKDNPYVGEPGALEAIFTIGNRNVQGIGQHPVTGALWAVEHGPMGGDELNILEKGKNYGWPVITYGLNYDGSIVSDLTEKNGMEQPIKYWKPSPGIGPLLFYTGNLFPKWNNQVLVGAMAFEEIKRLELGAHSVEKEEVIMKGYGRVRDLKVGPEGAIYVVLNNPNQILRLTPRDNQ
jgi:glucose/arabinose dehydrogenase